MGRRIHGWAAAALALAACAGPAARVEQGVFRMPDRFRVTVPGPEWDVAPGGRADLELRHRAGGAGILTNVECGTGRELDLAALTRRLFVGLRARNVLENGAAIVGGLAAAHAVLEVQVSGDDERVRVEAYVLKDEGCVYDLVYVAPAARFAERRPDFQRFVDSFVRE
ncbi:MAG TPA: hypothetical protein VEA38_06030 [Terriglobales bacterium]|nr:hypothetical protein [Terriglobales bacterium]